MDEEREILFNSGFDCRGPFIAFFLSVLIESRGEKGKRNVVENG